MAKAPPILARVFRGSRVESAHRGSVAVVDENGARIASCGDDSAPVFARSAAKPFQAMPLLLAGGARRFGLTDPEIALLCASHGGEPRHTRAGAALLRKGGFRVEDLECGAHMPMHDASARALIRAGEAPNALHNNCSGKHAGMLLACRLLGWPHVGYTDAGHPLQRTIHSLLALYAGVSELDITVAVDGCNAPVFRLPLSALATAYARLLSRRVAGEDRGAAEARARIVTAMARRPEMVAGSGRFTTDFLRSGRGRWIGKEGAEGVYALAFRGRKASAPASGVAFKIEDGSARARDTITLDLLGRLGALPDAARRALRSYVQPAIRNARGLDVGRIEAEVPVQRSRMPARKRRPATRAR